MNASYRYVEMIIWLALISPAFLLLSCGKENSDIQIQNIELPVFTAIQLDAVFDVKIMEADIFTLQIRGAREAIENITYLVEDQRLTIGNTNSKLWLHPKNNPPELIITGKGLTRIDVNETCNIESLNTITTDTFGIILYGKLNIASLMLDCTLFYYWNAAHTGGLLTLEGQSDLIRIYNSTLMAVDASQFPCKLATVETSSKSDIRVFVREKLDYSITGTGDIYLSGNPAEIVAGKLYSTGRLIQ